MSKEIISKTKRISDILVKLEEGPITLKELHGFLKVSLRTLQRDINLILNTEIPMSFKKNGTYAFINDFSLKCAGLTPQKAAMLVISNSIIDGKAIKEEFKHLKADINRAFYPAKLKSYQVSELPASNVALALKTAIKNHKIIRVTLKDTKKNLNLRPYMIVTLGGVLFVIHISANGEIYKYAIDNIKSASLRTKLEEDYLPLPARGSFEFVDYKKYPKPNNSQERTFKPHKMMEWKILSYIESK